MIIGCSSGASSMSQRDATQDVDDVDLEDNIEVFNLNGFQFPKDSTPSPAMTSSKLQDELSSYTYRVGPGDILNITVWDHPELTIPAGSMRPTVEAGNWVHSDSTLFYPYVGKVNVVGMDVVQIRDTITKSLAEYIESPQVDITVAAFKSQRIVVAGAVNRPGIVPVTNIPATLIDVINSAGGLSEFADWSKVQVTRNSQEVTYSVKDLLMNGDISQNVLLQHGDIVHVPRDDNRKIFVMGEVSRPQTLKMDRIGMSLAEALASSGGLNEETSDASGVFVLRAPQSLDQPAQVYQLDISDATALILADRFKLESSDIVFVTSTALSRWNRVIRQVLPTAQFLWYGVRLGVDGTTLSNTLGE